MSDSNRDLRQKRREKDDEAEEITKKMEEYIKAQTIKKLSYNNNIAAQKNTLDEYETKKAKLSLDNEENATKRLN